MLTMLRCGVVVSFLYGATCKETNLMVSMANFRFRKITHAQSHVPLSIKVTV